MPLLDAYATAAEYKAFTGLSETGETALALLLAELTANTRLLERELRWAPGAGNSVTAAVRTFDGHGGNVLYLRDTAGMQEFLQTVGAEGIGVDTERDGTYDGVTLDFNDVWLRGRPENAAAHSEPYKALELLPFSSSTLQYWPDWPAAVRITGTLGWATVPVSVKHALISMTRDLRDHFSTGSRGNYQQIDESMPLSDQTWRLIRSIKQQYGRRIPAVA